MIDHHAALSHYVPTADECEMMIHSSQAMGPCHLPGLLKYVSVRSHPPAARAVPTAWGPGRLLLQRLKLKSVNPLSCTRTYGEVSVQR